jgi:membrane protease subunit HflC
MGPKMSLSLIVLAVVVIVVGMSVFVVDQRQYAIKLQLGEIVRSDYEPGLHFKWPFVQNVFKYPNRILTYDDSEERFLTGEQKNLIVDYFVTWRITDPARYYVSVRGDEDAAKNRLSAIVKEGIKAAISQRDVQEVVSAERSELMDDMLVEVKSRSPELGIQVVDVRVKRIDLEDEVSESVYERMREERRRTAQELRAEGNEQAERTRADADRQRTVIIADARRDAEIIRGEGDAMAADIYAQAYSADPDFYAFYRSMSAYRQSIGGPQDVLVLQPDSEFFRYLQSQLGTEVVAD